MKNWKLKVLVGLVGLVGVGRAQLIYEPEIEATISLTNIAGITNGAYAAVNGDQRTWTNNPTIDPSIYVHITNTLAGNTTNLWRNLNLYAPAGPVYADPEKLNTTNVVLIGQPSQSLVVTLSPGWAYVTYKTNFYTNSYPLNLPPTVEPTWWLLTMFSEVVRGINLHATNKFLQTAPALVDFVNVSQQQSMTNKNLFSSTNRNGQNTNVQLRMVWMGGTGVPGILATNQDRLYFGTNNGAPWMGYLAPGTNGMLGLFHTNGAPWSYTIDEERVPPDEQVPTWGEMRWVLPLLDPSLFPTVQNFWTTTNTFASLRNIFSQNLQVYAGFYGTGVVAVLDTNWTRYGAVGRLAVLGTNGTSSFTNFDGQASSLTVTSLTALAGTVGNVTLVTNRSSNSSVWGTNFWVGDVSFWTNSYLIGTAARHVMPSFTNVFVSLDGAQQAYYLDGLQGGREGKWHVFKNNGGFALTIEHESATYAAEGDRFRNTLSGAVVVPAQGWFKARYFSGRWDVEDVYPNLTAATNAIAFLNGHGTNMNFWASAVDKVPVQANQFTNSWTNTWQAVSPTGGVQVAVSSNGTLQVRGGLQLAEPTTATLSSDAVTLNRNRHYIDTEGAAASDDLVTINGLQGSGLVVLSPANDARTIKIKQSGNIRLRRDNEVWLQELQDIFIGVYDSAANQVFGITDTQGFMVAGFAGTGTINPADSTTYYVGHAWDLSPQTTYSTVQIPVMDSGTVVSMTVCVRMSGGGTTETVSHYARVNDTTDYGQTDFAWDASKQVLSAVFAAPLTRGDNLALKIVAPAWATNPTGVRVWVFFYIVSV